MGKQKYNHTPQEPGRYNAAREREENIIGQRILRARLDRGISLREFSEELKKYGISIGRQGVGKWECGISVPNGYQLLAICHALGIEDGISYFTGSPAAEDALNQEGLKKLRDYKEDLIASGRYQPEAPAKNNIVYIHMPVSTLPASAGTGAFLEDENFELVSFPENTVPGNADFGVRVSGDSMEPVYHDGQIVWVQRCNELSPGEVGLFLYDGDGYIKVYDEIVPEDAAREDYLSTDGVLHMQPVLISYNKAYAPRVISPELSFSIAGRILN